MPRLLICFGSCPTKPGNVGYWEGCVGLGLNQLHVTWADEFTSLGGDYKMLSGGKQFHLQLHRKE